MKIIMTTKTTKTLMVAALIAAIVIPASAFALDDKPMTAEEEGGSGNSIFVSWGNIKDSSTGIGPF